MIDKKISLGTIITIATIIGTFIYTQGIMDTKVSAFEEDTSDNRKKKIFYFIDSLLQKTGKIGDNDQKI